MPKKSGIYKRLKAMNLIRFNPSFAIHKTPLGANAVGEVVTFKLMVDSHYQFYQVRLLVIDDQNRPINRIVSEPMKTIGTTTHQFQCALSQGGIYWYYFEVDDVYGTHFITSDEALDALLSDELNLKWHLGIYEATPAPKWPIGKIMYQIMVDRFAKGGEVPIKPGCLMHQDWNETPLNDRNIGRDFFGGTLQGIIKKLDYLQSLSVGIIYLNPIFEASSNHKYDTADFMKIDPMFGSEEDLKTLIQEAKKRSIELIIDGVFNHTGADSIYFNRYQNYPTLGAYQSKESPYYHWYRFIHHPNQYHSWWGFKNLPSVDQSNEDYLEFITGDGGVLNHWMRLGLRGIRLDVVDELSNELIHRIRTRLKAIDPESFIIGEVWEDASTKSAYGARRHYFNGHQLDSVMNYPLRTAILHFVKTGDAILLRNTMRLLVAQYPKSVLDRLMNIVGTHDTERLCTALNIEPQEQFARYQLATLLQYTLPGIPCLYYGDDIGLAGAKDPFCRGTFRWERVGNTYHEWMKQLGTIRKEAVFAEGEYQEVDAPVGVFIFVRKGEDQTMIIINASHHPYTHSIENGFELLSNISVTHSITIAPLRGAVIKITH
jgi:glycosidase